MSRIIGVTRFDLNFPIQDQDYSTSRSCLSSDFKFPKGLEEDSISCKRTMYVAEEDSTSKDGFKFKMGSIYLRTRSAEVLGKKCKTIGVKKESKKVCEGGVKINLTPNDLSKDSEINGTHQAEYGMYQYVYSHIYQLSHKISEFQGPKGFPSKVELDIPKIKELQSACNNHSWKYDDQDGNSLYRAVFESIQELLDHYGIQGTTNSDAIR